MMLLNVVLGAVAGAVAGLAAYLAKRRFKLADAVQNAIFIVTGVLLFSLMRVGLEQPIRNWQIDNVFDQNPAFVALAKRNPKAREEFRQQTAALLTKGASMETTFQQSVAWGRTRGQQLMWPYIAQADDPALVATYTALAKILTTLTNRDDDVCFTFLWGNGYGSRPLRQNDVPPADMDQLMRALARAIDSADGPRPPPTSQAIAVHLDKLVTLWVERDGEKVALSRAAHLDMTPTNATTVAARKAICDTMATTYSDILKLPPHDHIPILRFMAVGIASANPN